MNSIVLNTANAGTTEDHKLRLSLTSDLHLNNNLVSLSHCSIYYNWKNFKKEYGNTQFTIHHLPSTTIIVVDLPDGSYSVRDINNYIHHIMKLAGYENADGTYDINVYANPVYNRVTISVSNVFQFSMTDPFARMLGFDTTQTQITNAEVNGNLVPQIEVVDTVLIHCNLVDNRVTHDSSILFAFVPNDSFGNLLSITPNYPQNRFCRNASFSYVEVYFTDQDGKALHVEDRILVELQIAEK